MNERMKGDSAQLNEGDRLPTGGGNKVRKLNIGLLHTQRGAGDMNVRNMTIGEVLTHSLMIVGKFISGCSDLLCCCTNACCNMDGLAQNRSNGGKAVMNRVRTGIYSRSLSALPKMGGRRRRRYDEIMSRGR
jgi:hypothetical protein